MKQNNILENSEYLSVDKTFGITRWFERLDRSWLHTHEFIEINYVHKGKGTLYFKNEQSSEIIERPVSRGDVTIIKIGSYHCFVSDDTANPIITYNIMFTPQFLDENLSTQPHQYQIRLPQLFDYLNFDEAMLPIVHLNDGDQALFDQITNAIFMETVQKQLGYANMLRAYVIEIITKVSRTYLSSIQPSRTMKAHILTQQIMEYINETYNFRLNLDEIAEQFYFTKPYICKVFKKNTGMTLTEYQHMIRIEKASQYLIQSDMKIVDIAHTVGFCDYKSFYSAFYKITGKHPREYRNENSFSPSLNQEHSPT